MDEPSEFDRRRFCLAVIRLIYYTRFSVMAGAGLILLGLLPWFVPLPTITAAYIQSQPQRMATVTMISFLAAALVIMTFRTTLYNAAARFSDPEMESFADTTSGWIWNIRRYSWLIIGTPVPVACLLITLQEVKWGGMKPSLSFYLAVVIGFSLAFGILALLAFVHRRLVSPGAHDPRFFPFDFSRKQDDLDSQSWKLKDLATSSTQNGISPKALSAGQNLASALRKMGLVEGYLVEKTVLVDDHSEPAQVELPAVGHGPLILFTLSLLIINLLILALAPWAFQQLGWIPSDSGPFGFIFFLVGLLMVFIGILPGISFALDRFRIPTSWFIGLLFVVFSACTWLVPGIIVDHEYHVAPQPIYVETEESIENVQRGLDVVVRDDFLESPILLDDIVSGWAKRQQRLKKPDQTANRTFVVVTAAGGGIQASGWTTQVLSELAKDDELRDLVSGIGLISSVSGGSVGILQFLTRYPELISAFEKEDADLRSRLLEEIHTQSTRSSLEAVGWGLLFPDTWRNFGVVRNPYYDRGWVQELVWADRMNLYQIRDPQSEYFRQDWRLGHLAYRVKNGTLPAVVFNGFSTTTGQRVWMAPFRLRELKDKRQPLDFLEFSNAWGMQLRLSTAARLSSTFPYVSPTAIGTSADRIQQPSESKFSSHMLSQSHLGDGGYTDNEGLLTALELINRLDNYYEDHPEDCPFDEVFLLRIAPFPSPSAVNESSCQEGYVNSYQRDSLARQGILGPLLGLYRGRTATQMERGELELQSFNNLYTLREELEAKINAKRNQEPDTNPEIRLSVKQNRQTKKFEITEEKSNQEEKPLRFEYLTIDFRIKKNGLDVSPPLSWMLNKEQKKDLSDAWKAWNQSSRMSGSLDVRKRTSTQEKSKQAGAAAIPIQAPAHPKIGPPNIDQLQEKFREK